MFLIRLIHLKGISNISKIIDQNNNSKEFKPDEDNPIIIKNPSNKDRDLFDLQNKTIGQIKNVFQEKDPEQNIKKKNQQTQAIKINSFDNLLEICNLKKEVKLKYELEKNVNLVSFENQRIEISFNDDLGKEFIKILSSKLNEWTGNRWIITLSKKKGEPSKKEKEINLKKDLLEKTKESLIYKKVLETFSDAELVDIEKEKENND
jgi:DNA polymerase-3 subunit gamma/tau